MSTKIVDHSPVDMNKFYRPDFRAPTPGQYETIYQGNEKSLKANFKLSLQKANSSKISKKVIVDPLNKSKTAIK
jgi:hypothetical protein